MKDIVADILGALRVVISKPAEHKGVKQLSGPLSKIFETEAAKQRQWHKQRHRDEHGAPRPSKQNYTVPDHLA